MQSIIYKATCYGLIGFNENNEPKLARPTVRTLFWSGHSLLYTLCQSDGAKYNGGLPFKELHAVSAGPFWVRRQCRIKSSRQDGREAFERRVRRGKKWLCGHIYCSFVFRKHFDAFEDYFYLEALWDAAIIRIPVAIVRHICIAISQTCAKFEGMKIFLQVGNYRDREYAQSWMSKKRHG